MSPVEICEAAHHSPGVLNRGNSTVEMSIQIGHRMAHLRLENAEATTEQALGEILATHFVSQNQA